jgi:hypothetical protein
MTLLTRSVSSDSESLVDATTRRMIGEASESAFTTRGSSRMSCGSRLRIPATASRTSIAAASSLVLLENSIVTRLEP